jgi:hypothetical protein
MHFLQEMTVFVKLIIRMLALAFETRCLFKSWKILTVTKSGFGIDSKIVIPRCLIRKCYRRDD